MATVSRAITQAQARAPATRNISKVFFMLGVQTDANEVFGEMLAHGHRLELFSRRAQAARTAGNPDHDRQLQFSRRRTKMKGWDEGVSTADHHSRGRGGCGFSVPRPSACST